ncbi:hypothetical protein Bbelb_156040 [Branchiostoma belcheri]|nr:hypothetical protein Bbelb_156040 [Branchiostoma belcheri]
MTPKTCLGVVLGKNTVLNTTGRATGDWSECAASRSLVEATEGVDRKNNKPAGQISRRPPEVDSLEKDEKLTRSVGPLCGDGPGNAQNRPDQEALHHHYPGPAGSASVSDLPRQSGWTQISFS